MAALSLTAREAIQDQLEALNFENTPRHTDLNTMFHETMYERHFNGIAFGAWTQHREIIRLLRTRIPIARGRQEQITAEHPAFIAAKRARGVNQSVLVLQHIGDGGKQSVDQLRIEQTTVARQANG